MVRGDPAGSRPTRCPTPPHIAEAGHAAALAGHTGYPPTAGIPTLRAALAEKIGDRNGFSVDPQQIVLDDGRQAKQPTASRGSDRTAPVSVQPFAHVLHHRLLRAIG